MKRKYVNEFNLQIAMAEYQENIGKIKDYEVKTQYGDTVGYVAKVYDNENGHGGCFSLVRGDV